MKCGYLSDNLISESIRLVLQGQHSTRRRGGQLEAAQHVQFVNTLLGMLTDSATPQALAENWQRIATRFDLLLDRPQAVDPLEQTILQLAVRGLLVPQVPPMGPPAPSCRKSA